MSGEREPQHGRYYAQELVIDGRVGAREQIQEALDAGESNDWELVGVSHMPGPGAEGDPAPGPSGERGVATGRGARSVMLVWDTQRPSFARSGS